MHENDVRLARRQASIAELPQIDLVVAGLIPGDKADRARSAVARAIAEVDRPVAGPVLRLTAYSGAARRPLIVAQVNATLGERLVRSQTAAPTVPGAADRLVDGLRRRLQRVNRHLTAEAAGWVLPALDRWPAPFPAAPFGLVAPSGRSATLIRTKTYPPAIQHVDAAAFTMDLRDYHFHLFLEDATLAPAVLHHGGPTGYRLIRAVAAGPADTTLPLTIDPETAPVLRVAQAIDRLNAAPAYRFLFFVDPSSGCGQVLYRRYDGHLGLLTAAW